LTAAHEIVAHQDCLQTMLAPDGRTLVCIGPSERPGNLMLSLIDVQTGGTVFEKKYWFFPNFNFALSVYLRRLTQDDPDPLPWALSADGNLLLVGPGSNRLAFDLRTRTPISISGTLRDEEYATSYAFVGNDRVAAINRIDPAKSGIFSFPEGRRLEKLTVGLGYMKSTTGDHYFLTTGVAENNVALADIEHGTSIFRSHGHSLDVFGSLVVAERADGSLSLDDLSPTNKAPSRLALLPLSPLAYTHAVSISQDGRYLALSAKARGGIWDLSTGKQWRLINPFESGVWTANGQFLGRFATHEKQPERITEFTMSPVESHTVNTTLEEGSVLESGHLILWKSKDHKAFDLNVMSPFDNSLQWSRHYAEGRPSYTTNFGDDDLILSYAITSSIGKDKLREDPNLKALAAGVKEKPSGRILEIVNSADGTTRAETVIEVPRTYESVDEISRVGDLVYLSAADNRTFVYSLKTGSQLRQLFGYVVAADQPSGILCTSNHRDEIFVLDAEGKELEHLHLGSTLRYAAIRDHATQLIVLTADQRVRRFPMPHR
jgi:WD40 repeat protein